MSRNKKKKKNNKIRSRNLQDNNILPELGVEAA
jgi:hypothetical protein